MLSPIQILADISGLGDFSGPLDDLTNPSRVLLNRGLTCSRGKNQIKEFAQGEAGRCEFTLDNSSGDYDGVARGIRVCVKLRGSSSEPFTFVDGDTFTFVDGDTLASAGTPGTIIWTGIIDDLQPEVSRFLPTVKVSCLGMLSRLLNRTVSTPLIENETISQIINRILDAAGWPSASRQISPSMITLPYYCLDRAEPLAAIAQLVSTEGGSFYESRNGDFVFEDRHYRARQARCTMSQADYSDPVLRGRTPSSNLKEAVDACTASLETRQAASQVAIWQLGEALTLAPNQVKVFQVKGPDWFKNAEIPSPVGVDAEQTLTPTLPLVSDTFKVAYKGQQTAALAYDINAVDFKAALAGLSTINAGNVLVLDGPLTVAPFRVRFIDALGQQAVELLVIESSLNADISPATINVVRTGADSQKLYRSNTPIVGTFKILYASFLTGDLAANASPSDIENAVIAASGGFISPGDFVASGGTIDSSDIDIVTAPFLGGVLVSIISSLNTTKPKANINVVETIRGGGPDYVSTGNVTFTLNRTSGPSALLTAQADAGGVTMPGLQVRAQLFPIVNRHEVAWPEEAADPTWIDGFVAANARPPRIETPSVWPGLSRADGLMRCENFVEAYDHVRPSHEVELVKGFFNSDLDALFERDPSDRVTITPGEAFVEKLEYFTNGEIVSAKFGVEQVAA